MLPRPIFAYQRGGCFAASQSRECCRLVAGQGEDIADKLRRDIPFRGHSGSPRREGISWRNEIGFAVV